MEFAIWVISGLLAAVYVFAGVYKLINPKEALLGAFPWVEDLPPLAVKAIAVVEILGGVGIIVPWALQMYPILTPLAAAGLVLIQLGAVLVHIRRRETDLMPLNAILLLNALFVGVFRYITL